MRPHIITYCFEDGEVEPFLAFAKEKGFTIRGIYYDFLHDGSGRCCGMLDVHANGEAGRLAEEYIALRASAAGSPTLSSPGIN